MNMFQYLFARFRNRFEKPEEKKIDFFGKPFEIAEANEIINDFYDMHRLVDSREVYHPDFTSKHKITLKMVREQCQAGNPGALMLASMMRAGMAKVKPVKENP